MKLETLSLLSWNVNGIRAIERKGNFDDLINLDRDIVCLQETKASPEQLDEKLKNPRGYFAYFNFSEVKKGYSGVALYTKIKPDRVEYGLPNRRNPKNSLFDERSDEEGRIIIAYYKKFVLINCYFPNGGGGPERLEYKLGFYDDFLSFITKLVKERTDVIFCGDVNTAHNEIDIARPAENENRSGFMRIERDWMDELVASGFVDVFRNAHPNRVQYSWWDVKTRARERNVGWRLDYFFVNSGFIKKVKSVQYLTDFLGSDHCPVEIEIEI